jgi:lysozyme
MELNRARLDSQLILHEGLKLLPYDDATGKTVKPGEHYRGKLTIGIGRNLDGNPLSGPEIAFIGHNCREQAITKEQALYLLNNDVNGVCRDLDNNLPWWRSLDEVRGRVLADMCFNMGVTKLLVFKNTLSFVRTGNYGSAADNMKKSLWYSQVGDRGKRLTRMMRTGEDWAA